MVYLTVAQCEGRIIKLGSPDVMFDASTWRIRNIWDAVKLEVAGNVSPVVLHSFTQLDPDLPLLEVRTSPVICSLRAGCTVHLCGSFMRLVTGLLSNLRHLIEKQEWPMVFRGETVCSDVFCCLFLP